jgi:hypothetical protein
MSPNCFPVGSVSLGYVFCLTCTQEMVKMLPNHSAMEWERRTEVMGGEGTGCPSCKVNGDAQHLYSTVLWCRLKICQKVNLILIILINTSTTKTTTSTKTQK